MPPRLQVHLPISPTPSFFTMVELFVRSLRRHGGAFADARVVVSVGEDCEPFDLNAANSWSLGGGVEWRWTDRELFRAHSYFATGMDRWAEPFTSDYVLMADADLVVAKDFSDAASLLDGDSIAGVIATYPPWTGRGESSDRERWIELFRRASVGDPQFIHPIPGHGIYYPRKELGASPPYFNFGFVLGTRSAMNRIRETFSQDYYIAVDFMKTDLSAQAGLCLSIVRHGLKAVALPVRYNFWTDTPYVRNFPDDLRDIRILHCLKGPFVKHRDTKSLGDVGSWARTRLGASDPVEALTAKVLLNALGEAN